MLGVKWSGSFEIYEQKISTGSNFIPTCEGTIFLYNT